jgi:hypothetical protein
MRATKRHNEDGIEHWKFRRGREPFWPAPSRVFKLWHSPVRIELLRVV